MSDRPTDKFKKEVIERDHYSCQNCNRKGGSRGEARLDVHHIVPLNAGGSNQRSNLVTLCESCHSAVHNETEAPEPVKHHPAKDDGTVSVEGYEMDGYKLVQNIAQYSTAPSNRSVSRHLIVTALTDQYGLSYEEAELAIQNAYMKGKCYEPEKGRVASI